MKKILKYLSIVVIIVVIVTIIYFITNNEDNVEENITYNYYKYYSNEKFGVIDKFGNILIEANYQDVIIPNPSYGILFLLENDEIAKVVNEKNEPIFTEFEKVLPVPVSGLIGEIPYEKNVLIYQKAGKQGLMDFSGKQLTKAIYTTIESLPYKEGELLCKTDDKVYILKENGKGKIKLENNIEIIADGYFEENNLEKSGYIISKVTSDGIKYGYINYKGKQILDFEYDSIERINNDNNYLIVRKNGQYGLYKNNEVIINCNYQEFKHEEDINLYFVKRGNLYGVLDENGKVIVHVNYPEIQKKGIFIEAISADNTKECFNLKGEKVEQFNAYNSIEKSKYDSTYIAISEDYSYKLLDNNYNVLTTEKYEYMDNILSGIYIAKDTDGKYGVINEQNIKLIENKYDVIQLINTTEVIQVMDIENNEITLFDKMGHEIFKGEDILVILDNGYIKVFCNEGIKYFTLDGKAISSEEIYENNTILGFYEEGKWGFKDRNNNVVVQAKYDRITEVDEMGYAGVKLNDMWGIIDANGKIIVEPKFYIDDSISEPEFLNKFYKNYYASVGAFYVE